jgi:hypothetical protein
MEYAVSSTRCRFLAVTLVSDRMDNSLLVNQDCRGRVNLGSIEGLHSFLNGEPARPSQKRRVNRLDLNRSLSSVLLVRVLNEKESRGYKVTPLRKEFVRSPRSEPPASLVAEPAGRRSSIQRGKDRYRSLPLECQRHLLRSSTSIRSSL